MTVKGKFQFKAGRKAKLASWLSLSGALAMVLFGGPALIAEGRSESSGRAASQGEGTPTILAQTEAPPGGASPGLDTQGPNAAPDVQESPSPGPAESPAGPTESPSPDAQQAPFPEPTPTESPATDEPAPPESPSPDAQQAPFPEPTPTESPSPEPTESPTSESTETREENIVFVSTAEEAETAEVADNPERFSQVLGSGRLIVDADNQVTGYYFTLGGLPQNQTLPYHFHNVENEGTPTSCEGDKAVLEDEAAGGILLPLNDIAPLQTTANGIAIIGSASSPIQLPSPVPLEDIGYLNIHANQDPASGIACANVRINPGGFVRAEQAESPSGGEAAAPAEEPPASGGAQPGVGPNAAPAAGTGEEPTPTEFPSPEPTPTESPTTDEPAAPESPAGTTGPQETPNEGPNTVPTPTESPESGGEPPASSEPQPGVGPNTAPTPGTGQ